MQIVAGPCLKACAPSKILVWLVTDGPCRPELVITAADGGQSLANSSVTTRELGKQWRVHLVKAEPIAGEFPQDQKLFYNLLLGDFDLVSLGLTSGARAITYAGEPLPSVVLASVHRTVAQMSCRKPHASGKAFKPYQDQVVGLDAIAQSHLNTPDRVTALFCTGDQIYADDVCPVLADTIKRMSSELFEKETLPTLNRKPVDQNALKLDGRARVMKQAGFTAGKANNHLLTFAEYVLMYVAVMGGLSLTFSDYSQVKPLLRRVREKQGKGRSTLVPSIKEREWKKRVKVHEQFFAEAASYRRVMANIPAFMMFDDHEVTDDWNINTKIKNSLKKAGSLGRRVQCNALSAFYFCQYWGCDNSARDGAFSSRAQTYISTRSNSGKFETELLEKNWSYLVTGSPAALCVDTRTQRRTGKGRPALVDERGFQRLENLLARVGASCETLLLISPAPVYGVDVIEKIQGGLTTKGWMKKLVEQVDAEYWSGNVAAFKRLHTMLETLPQNDILVLSGDVHYSFMREGRGGRPRLWQCTSSAVHNAAGRWVRNAAFKWLQAWERKQHIRPPYMLPQDGVEFVSGEPNVSVITFDAAGAPANNRFCFFEIDAQAKLEWSYDIAPRSQHRLGSSTERL
ncbi:MAG: hypothetical protein AAGI44_02020 [Pseudomonadota bacterium]